MARVLALEREKAPHLTRDEGAHFHGTHVEVLKLVGVSTVCHPDVVGLLVLPPSCDQLLVGKFDEGFAELCVRLVCGAREEVVENIEERHVGELLEEGCLERRWRNVVALGQPAPRQARRCARVDDGALVSATHMSCCSELSVCLRISPHPHRGSRDSQTHKQCFLHRHTGVQAPRRAGSLCHMSNISLLRGADLYSSFLRCRPRSHGELKVS